MGEGKDGWMMGGETGEGKDGWMEGWMGEETPGWRYALGNKPSDKTEQKMYNNFSFPSVKWPHFYPQPLSLRRLPWWLRW